MPKLSRLLLALAAAAPVVAQSPLPVGQRTVAWTNALGVGSPVLDATVYYPAVAAGTDTALASSTVGWPVLVFLHGYGYFGSDYAVLANAWAEAGFVVVLSDTSQWDYVTQAGDGHALHAAVVAAGAEVDGPFEGGLDTSRIALLGHSMGGANVANVLLDNPGYRCGFAFAPVAPWGSDLTQIHVPIGIMAGSGDWVTPPDWHALPYYLSVTGHESFKFLRVLGDDCDHMNFVGLAGTAPELVQLAIDNSLGFVRHALDVDSYGLEAIFGADAMLDPNTALLTREVAKPQLWLSSPLRLGQRSQVNLAVEGGPAVLFAAMSLTPGLPTVFGTLVLDPATAFQLSNGFADAFNRVDLPIDVPNEPGLIGLPVALQGLGSGSASPTILGGATLTAVEP